MDRARIEREFSQCNKCGLCLAACPVGKALLLEKYTPRGRVQLARFYQTKGLELSEGLRDIFSRCLLCGACSVACPSGVRLTDIFIKMRQEASSGLGLHPKVRGAVKAVYAQHNIAGDDNKEREEWAEDLEGFGFEDLHKTQAEVVYFVGCVSSFFPMVQSIPRNVVRIMRAAGVNFTVLGGEEWCCGFPLMGAGDFEGMEGLRTHNLEAVRALGAKEVVFSCPSCHRTWREYYGNQVVALHVTEFIARLMESGRLKLKPIEEEVTYHDPCDLGRHGGIYEPPRAILEAIPGLILKEMPENRSTSICCGGGGNLEMTDSSLSRRLAGQKARQALATGASTLVTACQQCVRTIKGATRREKIGLQVKDITDLLVETIF